MNMDRMNASSGAWPPGSVIGVLGGGQLGRMVILEGRKFGYRFVTLDPAEDCPGAQVADEHITGAYDDPIAGDLLAEKADLIVYEFENISPDVVRRLERQCPVPQGSVLLETTRHRIREKDALVAAGIPVAPYRRVTDRAGLNQAVNDIGLPAILKTATGGYDGKGQWRLASREDLDRLPDDLFAEGREFVLEGFVPFVKELSVVVARGIRGETAAFPPAVNLHRNGILHMSAVPAPLPEHVLREAVRLSEEAAKKLNVIGLLAVEMFCLADGSLLVNELAPRPHNSGHYTFDACETSQFEQFLRAVTGLPLGSPRLNGAAVMVNVLGDHAEAFFRGFANLPGRVKPHWYGKREAKAGRKMGHVTVLADSVEEALAWVDDAGIWPVLTEAEKRVMYEKALSTLTETGR
ncbi:5-(carboxyamino)imidazole ribonucleotide synthase [Staphylospora marina]|uniref:5-(carboxyamino)imidazole ribonucleotide synthase n=1 Tax=Staphylospora marina TaxID=2490858 RepID=UPI000F5BBB12|nr:5-(carboxyamino)imidazole ribonucleotide synthase [Staphylospora marina]